MSYIDLTSSIYSDLNQYAIFAENSLFNSNSVTNNTTVNSGYWYGATGLGRYNLASGTSPSGLKDTPLTFVASAINQLNTLITNIGTVTSSLITTTNIGFGGSDYTFFPGINYTGTGIVYPDNGITLTFDAGGDINAQFFITSSNYFSIINVAFNLINGARACNIFWSATNTGARSNSAYFQFQNSSNIVISNLPGIIIARDFIGIANAGTNKMNLNGHLFCKFDINLFLFGTQTFDINSTTCGYDSTIICYTKGTQILTKHGFTPIENIKAGQRVITKGKIHKNKFIDEKSSLKLEPVVWISKFKVDHINSQSAPICIKKHALGKNYPFKDLYVSPNHGLLLKGKMVLAKNLVNKDTIYQDFERENVEYYHLECDNHNGIFANGVLSESYLELDNRSVFEDSIKIKPSIRKPSVNLKALHFER